MLDVSWEGVLVEEEKRSPVRGKGVYMLLIISLNNQRWLFGNVLGALIQSCGCEVSQSWCWVCWLCMLSESHLSFDVRCQTLPHSTRHIYQFRRTKYSFKLKCEVDRVGLVIIEHETWCHTHFSLAHGDQVPMCDVSLLVSDSREVEIDYSFRWLQLFSGELKTW